MKLEIQTWQLFRKRFRSEVSGQQSRQKNPMELLCLASLLPFVGIDTRSTKFLWHEWDVIWSDHTHLLKLLLHTKELKKLSCNLSERTCRKYAILSLCTGCMKDMSDLSCYPRGAFSKSDLQVRGPNAGFLGNFLPVSRPDSSCVKCCHLIQTHLEMQTNSVHWGNVLQLCTGRCQ